MDPVVVVVFSVAVAVFAAVVVVALVSRPRDEHSIVAGSLHSDEAQAEIEAVDIDQMIEALSERRRLAGRPDVGDELAREALRRPPVDD